MNKLYDKIYEAINTGIQKALILDTDNDVSIKWHEKEKTNNINIINQLVDNLLNETNDEYNYNQIIEYYNNYRYKYQCNDIYELFQIFNKIKHFGNSLDIFKWIDTKNSLSFILDNNQEISLNDYNKSINPVFLKISNDALRKGNNDILIYIQGNHFIPERLLYWESCWIVGQEMQYLINDINDAIHDYDGYETCQRIINGDKLNNVVFPAIDYCDSIKNINRHKGYLPSLGQLKIMSDCLNLINFIFTDINAKTINLNTGFWWSSTEKSYILAWYIANKEIYSNKKDDDKNVLPIFTL